MAAFCTDAGHGGADTGAVYHDIREKDVNIAITLLLNEELKRRGHTVLTTRKSDEHVPPLITRCRLVNAHFNQDAPRFDAIISLHCDVALRTDELTGLSEPIPDRQGLYAIYSQESDQSTALARAIAASTKNHAIQQHHNGLLSTIELGRTLAWIHKTLPPAILIEMGYLTNEHDRQMLHDPAFHRTVVTAIADGCEQFSNQS